MIFRHDPPVSRSTIARWQAELDEAVPVTDRLSRLVLRWEAGDSWQPIQRFVLWQCVDPKYVAIEPWNRRAINGPNPRATGHYCAPNWCICTNEEGEHLNRQRWVGGASKVIDRATWELYRDTGLYGQRWWTIQGHSGGHRFQWAKDELASHVSVCKGGPADTPMPGDLPYAPFDRRVIRQVLAERRVNVVESALKGMGAKMLAASFEEQEEAKAKAKALWDWASDRADELWYTDGADRLPRYFEETYGRVPTGSRPSLDPDAAEQRFAASF